MDQEELEPCFTGTFEHTLDVKGRVSLPSKIRRSLPATVKTVLGLDNDAILVFDPKAYKAWVDGFFPDGYNPLSRSHVKLKERLTAFAEDADIDSAGRIGISTRLRSIVGLEKDVTITGCDNYLKIVDRAKSSLNEDELLSMTFMVD